MEHRRRVLIDAAGNMRTWSVKVRKMKAIYHTLNMFNIDISHKALIGECWCPIKRLDKIRAALRRGTVSLWLTIWSYRQVVTEWCNIY